MRLGMGLRLSDRLKFTATPSSLLTGLVSYWTLNETSGTRADSVGDNDLTDNNTVGYDTGKNGNAASFVKLNEELLDGAGGVNVWPVSSSDSTVAFWIKTTSTSNTGIMGHYGGGAASGILVGIWNSDQLMWLVSPGDTGYGVDLGVVNDGNWHLVVLAYNATTGDGYGYIDDGAGVKAFTQAAATTGEPWSVTFNIGRYSGSNYFEGLLDELAIWTRVLSDPERAELYNSGVGKFYPFT